MLQSLLKLFSPWVLLYVLVELCHISSSNSMLIALGLFIVIGWSDLRAGFIFSWLTLLFFILQIFNVNYLHWYILNYYATSIFYSILSCASWVSIAASYPITIQHSKKDIPKEKLNHPLFIRINYAITILWGIIFAANASINYHIQNISYSGQTWQVFAYVLTIGGIYFSFKFPQWYRKKFRHSSG